MSGGPFEFGAGRSASEAAPADPAAHASAPAPARFTGGWDGRPRGAVRPPVAWLVAALVVALLAAVLALVLGGTVGVAVVCWVAAGPVAIGLVALFVLRDTRAAAAPIYLRPTWIRPLYGTTITVVIVGIAASAWRIADWWGRL